MQKLQVIGVLLVSFFAVGLFAADFNREDLPLAQKQSKAFEKRVDIYDTPSLAKPVVVKESQAAATLPGTKVGETAYNYQTNDNLKDRIFYNPADGTIHVQWMFADIAETATGFPGRRMYYDFFNGASWNNAGTGIPIESARAGYGALAVTPDNRAVGASHHTPTNDEETNVWTDFAAGFGFFSQARVWQARNGLNYEPFWPDVAVDDLGNYYVTATNNNQDDWVELVNGVNDNIFYSRSVDSGVSWSAPVFMFPDTTTYKLGEGASGPSEAGSHQVAASTDGSGKVGILVSNPGHDFYFFESTDRGATFNSAIQVIGREFPVAEDSLTYPMLWDVAVEYDSVNTDVAVDTSLTIFTGSDSDGWEPNVCQSPHGPADLFYLGDEPHVVWSEMVHVTRSDGLFSYPNGYGHYWTTDHYKYLDGNSEHTEGGFAIKHWSPSTGVSTIYQLDSTNDVSAGTFQQFVTMPQIGADADGNLYCVFTHYSETDTLVAEDGIEQADDTFGPLSYGKIWGAKSTDGGKTWFDAAQLIADDDCEHQNLRYISIADKNGADAVHILYQNTPEVPGVPIGEGSDHTTWTTAEMMHWQVPTSLFPDTDTPLGPEIELVTRSTIGGLDFGDIADEPTSKMTIKVLNKGDQDLVVGPLFTSDRAFTATPKDFTVAPGSEQIVTVEFMPYLADSLYEEFLALPNNDPSEGAVGIPLVGEGNATKVADRFITPEEYELRQNYPNPFNPSTAIEFSLKATTHVKLTVYNTIGKEVGVLADEEMSSGSHKINWQPKDLSTGVYFYHLSAGDFTETRKMIYIQ